MEVLGYRWPLGAVWFGLDAPVVSAGPVHGPRREKVLVPSRPGLDPGDRDPGIRDAVGGQFLEPARSRDLRVVGNLVPRRQVDPVQDFLEEDGGFPGPVIPGERGKFTRVEAIHGLLSDRDMPRICPVIVVRGGGDEIMQIVAGPDEAPQGVPRTRRVGRVEYVGFARGPDHRGKGEAGNERQPQACGPALHALQGESYG